MQMAVCCFFPFGREITLLSASNRARVGASGAQCLSNKEACGVMLTEVLDVTLKEATGVITATQSAEQELTAAAAGMDDTSWGL